MAFHNLGAECVFVSEWDSPARKTYQTNFEKISPKVFKNGNFAGDIMAIDPKDMPDFDILTGGFPCQPFSQAGKKKGFEEARGTMFFKIAEIIKAKQPKAFFIENVRHFMKHNNGETFKTVKRIIEKDLGYSFFPQIIKASDYGLPTHRPRLYMVGFKDKSIKFDFPETKPLSLTMSDIFGGECNKKIGYTLRVGGRHSGLADRRNWDTYLVDGKVRRISIEEGRKIMGFPQNFLFPVSETQAMKQLGNSVAVTAIQATAEKILDALKESEKK